MSRHEGSFKCVTLNYEMDSSNEDIDQQVLQEAGEQTISAEWSATVSALSSSDTTSSNTYINIETLKECCANPSDTLKDKEDFMVFESSSTVLNTSKFNANDTKCRSEYKTTAFQKRKRLRYSISEDFIEFNNVVDDSSINNNIMDVSKADVLKQKFSRKTINVPDTAFDNIINDLSMTCDSALNNKKTSLNEISVSNVNNTPMFSKTNLLNLNHTYDVHINTDSSTFQDSISDDADIPRLKQNTVFKKPSNTSILSNDSSNSINVSNKEVFTRKFNRKIIDITNSAFDNIINDSSMTSDIALNNKNTSLNEVSVSNVNNTPMFSKTNLINLNHTYDVHINTDSSTFKDSISDDVDIPRLKQNTVFKKPSNTSILSNDSSNSIDVSNKEVFTHKFNRKIIDITNSAFDNIINDSSMTSDIALNNKKTSLNEVSVSNVNNTPMFSKTNLINLNHTYDVHINTDSSTFKDSISDDVDIPRLKQNTVFKKPSNTSILSNDGSNSIDVSNKEVFTHKFNRKIIDITNSAFDNIINDSSMTSDIALNNKNISLNEVSVSNVNNTPVFNPMDISNLNHTYNVPIINNTTFLDNVVENDKSMSETPTLLKFNTPKSLNLLPLKFNFSNKIGRHSLSYQEKCTSFDGIKKHNISLNTDFIEYTRDKSNTFKVGGNNENIDTHLHTSKIQETNKSSQETQPLDDSLSTNKLNQEQLKLKCSISSNLNNKDLLLPNTTKLLENNEFQKNQSKNSISSNYSSNEGLTLLNSTTGLLESCSSLRNQSRLLTSKNSKSSISHNTFNSTMELLDSNESQKTQLTYSTSVISNNDSLTLLSTTVGSLESNESQKTQSKRSISPSDNESLKSTNRRSSSRNKSSLTSNHSTSVISNNDSLTLLSTTVGSLESNESQKTQSKRSISPSDNESLKSTNRRSSSRNKSSLTSNHSTSVISNNDSLTLLSTTVGSLESNESQKTQSKRSISPSDNESLKSTNRRSSSRNKSSLTSNHSTSVISNNDSLTLLSTTVGSLESNESQKTQSKRSISPSDNESLKSTNRRSSPRNKSSLTSKHSTSVISNNDRLTLLSTTVGSLESNESQKTQSKRSISPSDNESLKSTNRRSSPRNKSSLTSKHSTSVISNNDRLTLLSTTVGSLESNESQKTQSKRSISPSDNESLKSTNRRSSSRNKSSLTSNHSTSVITNNDSLALSNTTVGSLVSNESQKTQSKRSISPSYNESLKSTNRRSSSRNKSSLLTSKHPTSVISNNDSLTLLNTTVGLLVSNKSQKTQSKRSISPSYNESLKSTNSTTRFLERRSSFRNKSLPLISKPSTSGISNNDSTTSLNSTTGLSVNGRSAKIKSQKIQSKPLKCATLNIEDLSTLNTPTASLKQNVSKQTSNCLSNVAPIIIDGLTTMNTTAEPFEQNVISIHQSNSSPNISIKTSINTLILEDDTNYTNKIYSSSSKQENHLHNNIDQVNPYITDGSLVEIRSSKVRVLRSSLGINKNNSLLTRSLTSNNNVNKLSTGSTRTSKSVVNFNDESFNNNSDNSLFWTTLPDETTSISNTQNNVNVNTFQTPKSNKLIITENIVNTIKIMSTNKQKSTHPGAFELDDHNDGPLTRSFVTRSCNRSPSILTLVFGGQKISESTSSLTHSLSETIIDQSPVEESIKQKFKSLYKKESWITKRLYKFLIIKLQPNYNIYSVKYAEKFIKYLAMLLKQIYNDKVNLQLYTDMLRYHMARYGIIKDTFDYLGFLSDYIPMAYYKKLVPGWNLETSAVKFDPQKYYIPLMDDEEFLNYIMKHLKEA